MEAESARLVLQRTERKWCGLSGGPGSVSVGLCFRPLDPYIQGQWPANRQWAAAGPTGEVQVGERLPNFVPLPGWYGAANGAIVFALTGSGLRNPRQSITTKRPNRPLAV